MSEENRMEQKKPSKPIIHHLQSKAPFLPLELAGQIYESDTGDLLDDTASPLLFQKEMAIITEGV